MNLTTEVVNALRKGGAKIESDHVWFSAHPGAEWRFYTDRAVFAAFGEVLLVVPVGKTKSGTGLCCMTRPYCFTDTIEHILKYLEKEAI